MSGGGKRGSEVTRTPRPWRSGCSNPFTLPPSTKALQTMQPWPSLAAACLGALAWCLCVGGFSLPPSPRQATRRLGRLCQAMQLRRRRLGDRYRPSSQILRWSVPFLPSLPCPALPCLALIPQVPPTGRSVVCLRLPARGAHTFSPLLAHPGPAAD